MRGGRNLAATPRLPQHESSHHNDGDELDMHLRYANEKHTHGGVPRLRQKL